MIFGINTTCDISKLSQSSNITISKYHSWYLCQISRTNHAITYTNHFKFQIFNHFTFQVLGNVFTKGIIRIQSMIRDKNLGEIFEKSIKRKKHINLVS